MVCSYAAWFVPTAEAAALYHNAAKSDLHAAFKTYGSQAVSGEDAVVGFVCSCLPTPS